MTRRFASMLAICALVVLGVGPPASADGPVVGPASRVGVTQAFASEVGTNGIDSAFDGTNTLVVWTDARGGTSTPDVYGARVAADGRVLDPDGIPIGTGPGRQFQPTATYDGARFVVAWTTRTSSVSQRVEVARVTRQGTVLDVPARSVGDGDQPAVASGDSVSLVSWRRSGAIRAMRLSPAGDPLDPPGGLEVARDPAGATVHQLPSVASVGTDFLVVYEALFEGFSEVAATAVHGNGSIGTSRGVASGESPAVASNRSSYLVAWTRCSPDCEFGTGRDVVVRRVAADDELTPSPPTDAATGPPSQTLPSVDFHGGRFLVAYRRQQLTGGVPSGPVDIRASYIDRTGSTNLAGGFIIERDVFGTSAVAAGPDRAMTVVYDDLPRSRGWVRLRTVAPK